MIVSFASRETALFYQSGVAPRAGWSAVLSVAQRKLDMLAAACVLEDLRAPPGNRLEALKGDRMGQHSIRVNDQWRVAFIWTDRGPIDVEIVDYH